MSINADLQKLITSGGIRSPNFFNGRLLTGEDLTQEREAGREALGRIGRALSDGVVHGLMVRDATAPGGGSPPTVSVAPGLAVNRRGRTLDLEESVLLDLIQPRDAVSIAPSASGFTDCKLPESTVSVAAGGAYLLLLSPARGGEGSVPVSGFDAIGAGCNTRSRVDGVQLRLVSIDFRGDLAMTDSDLSDRQLLQNRVAHACFNASADLSLAANPLAGPGPFVNPLDRLRPTRLTNCDVPLAIVVMNDDGTLAFVDNWSVRRRVIGRGSRGIWNALFEDARAREVEAVFLQFQEQLASLVSRFPADPALAFSDLGTFFAFLPPVGFIPIIGPGSNGGFDPARLINKFAPDGAVPIPSAVVLDLFRKAMTCPPVNLATVDLLQFYLVSENDMSVRKHATEQLYLVFTSRQLHGFLDTDRVAVTLRKTWESYLAVLRSTGLLPTNPSPTALATLNLLQSHLQGIIQYAMTREAMAASQALGREAVKATFTDLLKYQWDFADALRIDTTPETRDRSPSFVAGLDRLLGLPFATRGPGLGPTLAGENLAAVLDAQRDINTFLHSFAHDTTSGLFLSVRTVLGPTTILVGQAIPQPTQVQFVVENPNPVPVTVALSIDSPPPPLNWAGTVRPLETPTLNIGPKLSQKVNVVITPPVAVVVAGVSVTLTLRAILQESGAITMTPMVLTTSLAAPPPPQTQILTNLFTPSPGGIAQADGTVVFNVQVAGRLTFVFFPQLKGAGPIFPETRTGCTVSALFTFAAGTVLADWSATMAIQGDVVPPGLVASGVNAKTTSRPFNFTDLDGSGSPLQRVTLIITPPAKVANLTKTVTVAVTIDATNGLTGTFNGLLQINV